MTQVVDQQIAFETEILEGLSSHPKRLPSKYFYDTLGDAIFQEIMDMQEYYLTRSEMEIFITQSKKLARIISSYFKEFSLIELGAGDCIKTVYLLKQLLSDAARFTYVPIDISANVVDNLTIDLPNRLPGLNLEALNGEYFDMLGRFSQQDGRRKVVLCLGGNVGNMTIKQSEEFCNNIRAYLVPGDLAIIGFDLRKDPERIRAAYSDPAGITARFNLNLLERINRELGANFDLSNFKHYCNYDPETGACKSYLISKQDTTVVVAGNAIQFDQNEFIITEISQKFSVPEIHQLAEKSGFNTLDMLYDTFGFFTNAVWMAE
ncbi:L-histidine N(alpha)-methyltransferase [Mucilaginibacter sp. SG564]|uniref:L-histidine N(alpha)-methyltransferase n=1 Tax=Mucilaginibacter sp. SG564 TaxID=2587022 RepID=UPI001552657D|nr:L-histidine N(alpha)-methyltransferase [Mucilaginibacter sp. SG564]NOW96049.1 dimethylhistidine N-methyltransferase [Mucilaginibacter sp. SG564]